MRTRDRVALWVAGIAASASLAGAAINGVVQLSDDSGAPVYPSCVQVERQALDLALDFPAVAEVYAEPGKSTLPALADEETIERCGDPEEILEEVDVLVKEAKQAGRS